LEIGIQRESSEQILCGATGTIPQMHKRISGKEEISWYFNVKYNNDFMKMEVDCY
jgi:hypothetical protein